jgi:flagellar protein FliS
MNALSIRKGKEAVMTGYKAYQGNQVEGSGPLGLVLLTYEAIYKSLAHAHRAIEAGDLAAEADHAGRALEGIVELVSSLNMEEGGEVAKNLASLYTYMIRRLSEGMCTSSTAHIQEVMQLVQTLREGWQKLARDQKQNTTKQQGSTASVERTSSYQASGSHSSMQMARYAA